MSELAWQILGESGSPLPLAELAELIYGAYNPQSAWAAWAQVEDGLYFLKEVAGVHTRSEPEVRDTKPPSAYPGSGKPSPGRISWSTPGREKSTPPATPATSARPKSWRSDAAEEEPPAQRAGAQRALRNRPRPAAGMGAAGIAQKPLPLPPGGLSRPARSGVARSARRNPPGPDRSAGLCHRRPR